jgi:7-carboxy-7-deazaguanine synthase
VNPTQAATPHYPLSEVFGPTIQGEGPHTGRRCFFVRLGTCNLHCSWCDTPFTWDDRRYDIAKENPPATAEEIHDRLEACGARNGDIVVLSGGEPLIQHHRLAALFDKGRYVWHVETNGTISPPLWWAERVAHTTLSPKIAQDDDPIQRRLPEKSLRRWVLLTQLHPDRIAWKFVCRDIHDLRTVQALTMLTLQVDPGSVWIMPEGTNATDVLNTQRALADATIAAGFNLTTRLHTLVWGEERGR